MKRYQICVAMQPKHFKKYTKQICLFVDRFIARPCALGLKIQANGPRKAQANAILEKVFTAITMVCTGFLFTVTSVIPFQGLLNEATKELTLNHLY